MSMKRNHRYNAVVIGGGPGGLVTAAGLAGLGARVLLVEKREFLGGDCLNWGCVPSKALISSARMATQMKRAGNFGLPASEGTIEIARVMERVRRVRARIAPHDSVERFQSLGVEVSVGAPGRIDSPNTVRIGERIAEADHIVIATGAGPVVPAIDGLRNIPIYTNETIFDTYDPAHRRLAVLGGGPIGVELAQAFARLGVDVSLIEKAPRLLPREDPDASELVAKALAADGVKLFLGRTVDEVKPVADAFLIALGRQPHIENLGLENVGVDHDESRINVDRFLRTNIPSIWAIGDVLGGTQFTHYADAQARTVIRNILFPWFKQEFDFDFVPSCTFTSPEVARIGLNETEAREQNIAHDVHRFSLSELDRPVCEGAESGFVKVLTKKGRDRILGATAVGEGAGDWIHELVLAKFAGVGLGTISSMTHIYPTTAEAVRRAADLYMRGKLTPGLKRLLKWRWNT